MDKMIGFARVSGGPWGKFVEERLKRRRWIESSLGERGAGDREKVKMALRLRWESIMKLKWIARQLQMDSWTNEANCLAGKMK
jgi:hypothetical protein